MEERTILEFYILLEYRLRNLNPMSFWIYLCTEVWNASPWNASLREFIVTEWMRVEGVCGGHLVQPSCLYQDTCLFPRIISRDSFNILKEPDSITFLDSHGSVTPAVKNHFLMFRGHLLYFSACPLPLVFSLSITEKTLVPSSLHYPFRYVCGLLYT